MVKQVLDGVMPTIIDALISIIGIIATILSAQLVKYLSVKKETAVAKLGSDQYNYIVAVAQSIFYAVEQTFKSAAGPEKQKAFDEKLLARFPYLTRDEIEHFRESVVGQVKYSTKEICNVITTPASPAPEEIPAKPEAVVEQTEPEIPIEIDKPEEPTIENTENEIPSYESVTEPEVTEQDQ